MALCRKIEPIENGGRMNATIIPRMTLASLSGALPFPDIVANFNQIEGQVLHSDTPNRRHALRPYFPANRPPSLIIQR